MEYLPDFCQIRILKPCYFTFELPVAAFGIRDSMVMEISVEYMESKDQNQYLANIWCRQRSAHSKHFLYALAVPASADADAEESIVNALNDDSAFAPIMLNYIDEAAKHRCD